MNHIVIHNTIIEKAITSKRKKGQGVYYERHHIIPRCLGGRNIDGLVLLTPKEHFIIHKLLCSIFPKSEGLERAYYAMCFLKNEGCRPTAREYDLARKRSAELQLESHFSYKKGSKRPDLSEMNRNRTRSAEERNTISVKTKKYLKENGHPMSGKKRDDTSERNKNTVWTKIMREKLRKVMKNRNLSGKNNPNSSVNRKKRGQIVLIKNPKK